MQIRVLLLTMPRSPWNRGKPAIEHLGFSGLAQNLNSISLPHSTFPHSSDQHQHFIKIPNVPCNVHLVQYFHHGNTHGSWSNPSNRKKYPSFLLMPNFRKLQEDSKNVSLKIGSWKPQKLSQIFKNAHLEAPKWVKDPWNGLKSIRGSWGDHSGPFQG